MNIMGMGGWEIMIILIGALLIFGPDRLPEVAGQIGKMVRDLRKMTGDLNSELERTAGVSDIKKAVQQELGGIKSSVEGATKGVSSSVSSATKSVAAAGGTKGTTTAAKPASTATTAAAKTAAAKPAASAAKANAPEPKPVASKKDPLADVSFFEEVAAKTQAPSAIGGVPKPEPAVAVPAASNGHAREPSSVAEPGQLDALGRARQRRLSAGYNRRVP